MHLSDFLPYLSPRRAQISCSRVNVASYFFWWALNSHTIISLACKHGHCVTRLLPVLPGWTVHTNRGPRCLYEYTKFPSANRGQKHKCVNQLEKNYIWCTSEEHREWIMFIYDSAVKSTNISKLLIMQSSCASSRKAATLLRFLKHNAGGRPLTLTIPPSLWFMHNFAQMVRS